jgi:hypothetical protein
MKEDEFLTYARRMRAAGVLLHIEEDDEMGPKETPTGLHIRQVGGLIESSAFDIRPSGTGYRISLRITSNLPGAFAISHFGLELPWKDSNFNWLEDPIEFAADQSLYRFPGKYPLEHPREMVINHCASVTRMWSRGQSISGYLLAFGGPMPDTVTHGEMVPAIVNVVDQFNRKYSSPIYLWADRAVKFQRGSQKKAPRKRLFECRDPA